MFPKLVAVAGGKQLVLIFYVYMALAFCFIGAVLSYAF